MKIFKDIIISLLLLLGFNKYYGQQISGKVLDSESVLPLQEVIISSTNNKDTIITDDQGTFILPHIGTYIFSKKGYQKKTLTLNGTFTIIQLEADANALPEVVLQASQLPVTESKSTFSSEVIPVVEIAKNNSLAMAPVLNSVPGVYMQSGALNTARVIIRGIGSRNLYGTAKIRAYFKDIPLTTGNGESAVEDIEIGNLASVEIIKGPVSSIYGAGLGGSIHFFPRNAWLNYKDVATGFIAGSYGMLKGITDLNYGSEKNSFRLHYSNTKSDGYRDNSNYKRQNFTFVSNHFLNSEDVLSVIAAYVDLNAQIPSSIDKDTYLNNPEAAAVNWKNARGYEKTNKFLAGRRTVMEPFLF